MRIDDENKVVWCDEDLFDWHFRKVSRATSYYAVADAVDTYTGSKEFKRIFSGSKEFEIYLVAILRGYAFKLEQPQKYYWRKKKGYLASFEDEQYLFADEHEKTTVTSIAYASKFDETELMNVIGSVDFEKFEKVECE